MARCDHCRKKVGLNYIECKFCKLNVCIPCRSPEDHKCQNYEDKIRFEKDKLREKLEAEATVASKITPF